MKSAYVLVKIIIKTPKFFENLGVMCAIAIFQEERVEVAEVAESLLACWHSFCFLFAFLSQPASFSSPILFGAFRIDSSLLAWVYPSGI